MQKEKIMKNEMRIKEALDKEENKRRQKVVVYRQKNEKKQEETTVTEEYAKQQLEASKMICKEALEGEVIAQKIKGACESKAGGRQEEVCQKPEYLTTSRYPGEVEVVSTELKADKEQEKVGNMSESKCKWKESKTKHVDAIDSENRTGLQMGEDYIELNQVWRLDNSKIDRTTKITGKHEKWRELEATNEVAREEISNLLSDLRNGKEEAASGIQDTVEQDKMLSGVEDATATEQKTNEKIKRYVQVNLDTGNQGVKFPCESDERGKNDEHLNQEHNKLNFMSAGAVTQPVETGRKMKGTQPAQEVNESNQRAAQQVHASQSTGKNEKNDSLLEEDQESEQMNMETDLELERLRKMEEEREREKDRMAVDRTILETRERAHAEAHERAAVERAIAEVRQRVLNDARERLEKACPEARGKSFPHYNESVEARLRADRAAVERATAEARERAFEKAMAERTAFESRDRVDRSASDKFSASSRNSEIRPDSSSNALHSQGAGISNGSKYQYSTVYSERFGVEGESPQRCKARLERHRRMAERAANALEELNRRNLHAQREQAEKNRLAENLDADVERWSSGKEGNLRALLSTLQYILGADSGWHPIPLTEVITAAAVKKAYRKATLCVHPDKLQQRGASIQQKYICEKVFDLLKEAWNKFKSEEW